METSGLVDWKLEYEKEFRRIYAGLLNEETIDRSIKWNIDFIEKHFKPAQLEQLDFDKLWVEFEKFLEPYTSDLIIKPDYVRNAGHFKFWLKTVCSRFGSPKTVVRYPKYEICECPKPPVPKEYCYCGAKKINEKIEEMKRLNGVSDD